MAKNSDKKQKRLDEEKKEQDKKEASRKKLEEQRKAAKEKKKKKQITGSTILLSVLALLCVGTLSGSIYLATTGNTVNIGGSNDGTTNGSPTGISSDYSLEERGDLPPAEIAKLEATEAAAEILENSYVEFNSQQELLDYLDNIEEGDFSDIDESVTNSIRFVGDFDDDDIRIATYQAVISLSFMIKTSQAGMSGTPSPITPQVDHDVIFSNVHYDPEVGIAHVPVGLLSGGEDVGLTIDMVYVDGGWYLAPYSLLESIRVVNSLTEGDPLDLDDFM